jgi:hypothetical protein
MKKNDLFYCDDAKAALKPLFPASKNTHFRPRCIDVYIVVKMHRAAGYANLQNRTYVAKKTHLFCKILPPCGKILQK